MWPEKHFQEFSTEKFTAQNRQPGTKLTATPEFAFPNQKILSQPNFSLEGNNWLVQRFLPRCEHSPCSNTDFWFPSSQVTPQSFHRCSLILMAGRQHSSKAAVRDKQPTWLKPPEKNKQLQESSFEFHGREPGHSSHSHPTQSHFVEFSSQCKWFGHQQLPVQHIQVTVGTPLSPPRSGNFRADTWQPLRFQFERERSNSLLHNTRVFCIENTTSLATFPLHMEPSRPVCQSSREVLSPSQHSLPARLPAPAMPCFSLQEVQLVSFFTLLSASSLYQDTNTSNQIRFYLSQITSESFTLICKWLITISPCIL